MRNIYVLMGGDTAERHVSLMSGTNVALKLMQFNEYCVSPFLLENERAIWKLPYAYLLHHTTDEVSEACRKAEIRAQKAAPLIQGIREKLGLEPFASDLPEFLTLVDFIQRAKEERAFVFLGLHGGIGEDGTIQTMLEEQGIPFNGSGSKTSRLMMDKYQTALCIKAMQDPAILAMDQISFDVHNCSASEIWQQAKTTFGVEDLIVKPQCDGCSAGVVRLESLSEFIKYLDCLKLQMPQIPDGTFRKQKGIVVMPTSTQHPFLLERFIDTDRVSIMDCLHYEFVSGWCEMTVGILENKGKYKALSPSMTIASSAVLSVEEKFQGGTGVNLTPPPEEILSSAKREVVQTLACRAAQALGLKNYARLDLFVECATGRIRVIEANSLPALTPSTVLYHQALAENPPIFPKALLRSFIGCY